MSDGRKALFFDIDGTLLSEVNRNVPGSAKEALDQARKNGHLVFINSGRTYCLIGSIKKLVQVDGYCCGCGTVLLREIRFFSLQRSPMSGGLRSRASYRNMIWMES